MVDIRKNVKKYMTQAQLANILNITPAGVNQLLRNPTLDTLERIASALGCSVADLVKDDNEEISTSLTCPSCGATLSVNITLGQEE